MRYSPAGISKKLSQIVSEVLTQIQNVLVRWNLVAHRLGYEDIRLKEDTAYDSTVLDQKRF